MFYHDKRLQYPVAVTTPDPVYARMLQQAIGGVEGEIRVCMQYMFQAWGARGPTTKYRDMLLHTATEEIGHIEMLATAVALNLETAPTTLQEAGAVDGIVGAVMGGGNPRHTIEGMLHRHVLSTGMAAFPANSDGVPFDMSHIYASGNLAADMYCNVAAETTGRVLAVRLFNATQDPGMKDMLHFMIARDTMHQQQWLAVIEELGGSAGSMPIPNSFPQSKEHPEHNYDFFDTGLVGSEGAPGPLDHRAVDRRQGPVQRVQERADGPGAGARPGPARQRGSDRTDGLTPTVRPQAGRRGRRPALGRVDVAFRTWPLDEATLAGHLSNMSEVLTRPVSPVLFTPKRQPAKPVTRRLKVVSEYEPAGDQPTAIRELVAGIAASERDQVLLGVTGSGKTFSMAKVIEAVQKPTLILAPNKTLAAQLYGEMKSFFPDNAVEYFVSYYDYYQPEPTFRAPTRISRKTPRSTSRSIACATRRRR